MRSALVTGGAGFIGSHLATALVERDYRVRVMDNLSTGTRANLQHITGPLELIEGDVLSDADLARAIEGVDVVFHHAALASVPKSVADPLATHRQCATGTLRVLDAARRVGVGRVVYAASSSAYGDQPPPAKQESAPPMPMSPYAAAKLTGEMYCRAFAATYGLATVALRYFNVFGPRQDPEGEYSAVIPKFVTRMIRGERPTIFGDGGQSRDFIYIDDVVAANLAAATAEKASGACLNIGSGRQTNLLELVDALNRVLGTDLPPEFAPPRAGDIRDSLADISLAKQTIGFQPQVSFEEGLRQSADYYRSLTS